MKKNKLYTVVSITLILVSISIILLTMGVVRTYTKSIGLKPMLEEGHVEYREKHHKEYIALREKYSRD